MLQLTTDKIIENVTAIYFISRLQYSCFLLAGVLDRLHNKQNCTKVKTIDL